MIGDVGFDPLRLAEVQVDLSYARGAEIKHGRIAMLVRRPVLSKERPNESLLYQATVGFLVQEYVHLPGEAYQNSQPYTCPESWNHSSYLCLITLIVIPRLKAPWTVPWAANLQILLLAGCVELATADTLTSSVSAATVAVYSVSAPSKGYGEREPDPSRNDAREASVPGARCATMV